MSTGVLFIANTRNSINSPYIKEQPLEEENIYRPGAQHIRGTGRLGKDGVWPGKEDRTT
jgi:hypothetical protein